MRETKGATQKAGILRGTSAPKEDVGARHPFQVAHVQRIQGGEGKRDAVKDCFGPLDVVAAFCSTSAVF